MAKQTDKKEKLSTPDDPSSNAESKELEKGEVDPGNLENPLDLYSRFVELEKETKALKTALEKAVKDLAGLTSKYSRDRPAIQKGIEGNKNQISENATRLSALEALPEDVQKLAGGVNNALEQAKTAKLMAAAAASPEDKDRGALFQLTYGGQILGLENDIDYKSAKEIAGTIERPTFFLPFINL